MSLAGMLQPLGSIEMPPAPGPRGEPAVSRDLVLCSRDQPVCAADLNETFEQAGLNAFATGLQDRRLVPFFQRKRVCVVVPNAMAVEDNGPTTICGGDLVSANATSPRDLHPGFIRITFSYDKAMAFLYQALWMGARKRGASDAAVPPIDEGDMAMPLVARSALTRQLVVIFHTDPAWLPRPPFVPVPEAAGTPPFKDASGVLTFAAICYLDHGSPGEFAGRLPRTFKLEALDPRSLPRVIAAFHALGLQVLPSEAATQRVLAHGGARPVSPIAPSSDMVLRNKFAPYAVLSCFLAVEVLPGVPGDPFYLICRPEELAEATPDGTVYVPCPLSAETMRDAQWLLCRMPKGFVAPAPGVSESNLVYVCLHISDPLPWLPRNLDASPAPSEEWMGFIPDERFLIDRYGLSLHLQVANFFLFLFPGGPPDAAALRLRDTGTFGLACFHDVDNVRVLLLGTTGGALYTTLGVLCHVVQPAPRFSLFGIGRALPPSGLVADVSKPPADIWMPREFYPVRVHVPRAEVAIGGQPVPTVFVPVEELVAATPYLALLDICPSVYATQPVSASLIIVARHATATDHMKTSLGSVASRRVADFFVHPRQQRAHGAVPIYIRFVALNFSDAPTTTVHEVGAAVTVGCEVYALIPAAAVEFMDFARRLSRLTDGAASVAVAEVSSALVLHRPLKPEADGDYRIVLHRGSTPTRLSPRIMSLLVDTGLPEPTPFELLEACAASQLALGFDRLNDYKPTDPGSCMGTLLPRHAPARVFFLRHSQPMEITTSNKARTSVAWMLVRSNVHVACNLTQAYGLIELTQPTTASRLQVHLSPGTRAEPIEITDSIQLRRLRCILVGPAPLLACGCKSLAAAAARLCPLPSHYLEAVPVHRGLVRVGPLVQYLAATAPRRWTASTVTPFLVPAADRAQVFRVLSVACADENRRYVEEAMRRSGIDTQSLVIWTETLGYTPTDRARVANMLCHPDEVTHVSAAAHAARLAPAHIDPVHFTARFTLPDPRFPRNQVPDPFVSLAVTNAYAHFEHKASALPTVALVVAYPPHEVAHYSGLYPEAVDTEMLYSLDDGGIDCIWRRARYVRVVLLDAVAAAEPMASNPVACSTYIPPMYTAAPGAPPHRGVGFFVGFTSCAAFGADVGNAPLRPRRNRFLACVLRVLTSCDVKQLLFWECAALQRNGFVIPEKDACHIHTQRIHEGAAATFVHAHVLYLALLCQYRQLPLAHVLGAARYHPALATVLARAVADGDWPPAGAAPVKCDAPTFVAGTELVMVTVRFSAELPLHLWDFLSVWVGARRDISLRSGTFPSWSVALLPSAVNGLAAAARAVASFMPGAVNATWELQQAFEVVCAQPVDLVARAINFDLSRDPAAPHAHVSGAVDTFVELLRAYQCINWEYTAFFHFRACAAAPGGLDYALLASHPTWNLIRTGPRLLPIDHEADSPAVIAGGSAIKSRTKRAKADTDAVAARDAQMASEGGVDPRHRVIYYPGAPELLIKTSLSARVRGLPETYVDETLCKAAIRIQTV